MPGIVKIGKTTGAPDDRARQLHQTGVPKPFVVEHAVLCPDCDQLEVWMHEHLHAKRVDASREFFEIDAADAQKILNDKLREQVEYWLDDFIPDQEIVDADLFLDPGLLAEAHQPLGLQPVEAISAIAFITTSELESCVVRYREWTERRRLAMEAGQEPPALRSVK